MFTEENGYKNLSEMTKAIVKKISEITDPFGMPYLIFNNTKTEQWFKAEYLRNNPGVLMNVEFMTLSAFVNKMLTCEGQMHKSTVNGNRDCAVNDMTEHSPAGDEQNQNHILTVNEFLDYVIRALQDIVKTEDITEIPKELEYILSGNSGAGERRIDGIKLFQFANMLSVILFNAEADCVEITGWHKTVYDKALLFAKNDGCITLKAAFDGGLYKNSKITNPVYVVNNSYISKLYSKILKAIGKETDSEVILYSNDENKGRKNMPECGNVVAAPSVMRELEFLHTDICKKLEAEKNLKVSDFVVYVPEISDYATAIRTVFGRNAKGFTGVPFRIAGENREQLDVSNSLSILYEIADKRFFTRADFLQFIKNRNFMYVKGIDDGDIEVFKKIITGTNTHRNGDDNDDWENLKKRLLLATFTDSASDLENAVYLSDEEYHLPYSDMSLDEERIDRLIDIIDCLSAWASFFKDDLSVTGLSKTDIEKAEEILKSLFSKENSYGEEKNFSYAALSREIDRIKRLFNKIPATTFLHILSAVPGTYSINPADVFSGGVTFLTPDCDNIVPAKYTYFLGMSSAAFPRTEVDSELEIPGTNHKTSQEFDKMSVNIALAGSKNITFSYVNKDLKTDEEFFPSSVIPEEYIEKYKKEKKRPISIDEDRALSELYTTRELMRAQYYHAINSDSVKTNTEDDNTAENSSAENMPVITTRDIKNFLTNTLIYKYKKILRDSDDDTEDEAEEYELFDLGHLSRYSITKEIIEFIVEKGEDGKEDLKKKFKLENALPKKGMDDAAFDSCFNSAETVAKEIKDNDYKLCELSLLEFTEFSVESNIPVYCSDNGETVSFIEPIGFKDKDKVTRKDYLGKYACALMYMASKGENDGKEYNVKLIAVNDESKDKSFTLTAQQARETLENLRVKMTELEKIKYMDSELVEGKTEYSALDSLIEKVNGFMGGLNFFTDKNMIAPSDFGYKDEDISKEFNETKEEIKNLILFLKDKEKEAE